MQSMMGTIEEDRKARVDFQRCKSKRLLSSVNKTINIKDKKQLNFCSPCAQHAGKGSNYVFLEFTLILLVGQVTTFLLAYPKVCLICTSCSTQYYDHVVERQNRKYTYSSLRELATRTSSEYSNRGLFAKYHCSAHHCQEPATQPTPSQMIKIITRSDSTDEEARGKGGREREQSASVLRAGLISIV